MVQVSFIDGAVISLYFIGILAFGAYFARYTTTTKDFFFGGQRFSWWLIAMSCVATVVGSYSFMKYSAAGFRFGLSSSMTYLNDWLILPFFVIGWFPIIYFMRVTSIPEYFEKRFDKRTRRVAVAIILVYMVGYVGINFYTLGVALSPLLNINLYWIIGVIAVISAIYMHAGGQTSVIMTDLVQGFVLLTAGFLLLYLGLDHLGGFDRFWQGLPAEHRYPLANFNHPPRFNFVGIFWQDALASSVAFYFMNQGVMMRFMSVKSPRDGTKAIFAVVLVLMPLAALAIANSGWLGRAMVTFGMISEQTDPNEIFVVVAQLVTRPGVFGLILAALTAALMSTIDTLITAISAIFVNDIWKPFVPDRDDRYYLQIARWTAIGAVVLGVALVPLFAQEKSIYLAHGKFIASVTPAMIVVILLAVFWQRFTAPAAFWALIGGSAWIAVSTIWPELIVPFSHGVSPEGGYKYMRAFFGISGALTIAVVVTMLTPARPTEEIRGLVIQSFQDAKRFFKGGREPNDLEPGRKILAPVEFFDQTDLSVSESLMAELAAKPGDLVYVSDSRWYLGGLKSLHMTLGSPHPDGKAVVRMSQQQFATARLVPGRNVTVEKIL